MGDLLTKREFQHLFMHHWRYSRVLEELIQQQPGLKQLLFSCPSSDSVDSVQMIGYQNHIPGWGFAVSHGRKYHNRQDRYGRKANSGLSAFAFRSISVDHVACFQVKLSKFVWMWINTQLNTSSTTK